MLSGMRDYKTTGLRDYRTTRPLDDGTTASQSGREAAPPKCGQVPTWDWTGSKRGGYVEYRLSRTHAVCCKSLARGGRDLGHSGAAARQKLGRPQKPGGREPKGNGDNPPASEFQQAP